MLVQPAHTREPRSSAATGDLHAAEWQTSPSTQKTSVSRWLVVAATADDAAALRERLPGRTAIATSDAEFRRLTSDHFCFNAGEPGGWAGLVRAASAAIVGEGPLVVLDLPAQADADGPRAEHLRQLASAAETVGGVQVCAVTQATQCVVPGDRIASPEQARLWQHRRIATDPRWWLADLSPAATDKDFAALAGHLGSGGDARLVAVRDGRCYTLRPGAAKAAPVRVHTTREGGIAGVTLQPFVPREPGPGQIAIEVSAAALNFRDALFCMGKYPGQGDRPPTLGWECAGTVTATGPGTFGIAAGDEVIALAHPALATHVVTDAALTVLRPNDLAPAEAVTLPVAYVTAYYGLCELARMRPGDVVVIHTGTGGVGLAAVAIAQSVGAQVLATAGSPGKRALLRMMGVHAVADSRSADFAAHFRAATHGRGADIVLNTLAGEPREANWEVLAPYGRFVDLTKRDILLGGSIPQAPFARNLSFHAVDLADMVARDPRRIGDMLRVVVDLVASGQLPPLPFSEYPASDAATALAELARGRQTGKVVLTF